MKESQFALVSTPRGPPGRILRPTVRDQREVCTAGLWRPSTKSGCGVGAGFGYYSTSRVGWHVQVDEHGNFE